MNIFGQLKHFKNCFPFSAMFPNWPKVFVPIKFSNSLYFARSLPPAIVSTLSGYVSSLVEKAHLGREYGLEDHFLLPLRL